MKYNEAIKDLKISKVKKYVLTGNEPFLKDRFLDYFKNYNPNASILNFYPGEEQEALSTLNSSSLFEDQLIILRYYDDMKTKKLKESIREYDQNLVVVLSEEANLKASYSTEIIGMCTQVQCSKMPPYGAEYPSWVLSVASEKGYLFVNGAEDLFYKKIGPDMYSLFMELNKLMMYKGDLKSISPEDVEKLVYKSLESSTYDILEGILRKDLPKALGALNSHLKVNENIEELLIFLSNFFEKLYRLVIMYKSGISVESLSDILSLPPYLVRTLYLPKALSLGIEKITDSLNRLSTLSFEIRSSNIKKSLLDNFIFSFN